MAVLIAVLLIGGGLAFYFIRYRNLIVRLDAGERPPGAREKVEAMATRRPDDLKVQVWALRLELEAGDMKAAESRIEMLKIKAPADYQTLAGACMYHMTLKDYPTALPYCEKALAASRRSAADLNRLGSAYLKLDRAEAALPLLKEAQTKAPQSAAVLNNLGYCYLSRRQYADATRLFQEAIKQDPKYLQARKNLARTWVEMKKYEAATQELQRVLELAPKDLDALFDLAFLNAAYFHNPRQAGEYARQAASAGLPPERVKQLAEIIAHPPDLESPEGSMLTNPNPDSR